MPGHYLKVFSIVAALGVSLVGGINFVIDPFGSFESPIVRGINFVKPEMGYHEKQLKAFVVTRRKPSGLILGASRSNMGLNPEHEGWSADVVYNLSLGGANMFVIYRFFQHANSFRRLEQVVLGVDFLSFNPQLSEAIDFESSLLAVNENGKRNPNYSKLRLYGSLVSVDTLGSSFRTLRQNLTDPKSRDPNSDYMLPINDMGMMQPDQFPQRRYLGYRDRFLATVGLYITKWWHPVAEFRLSDVRDDLGAFAYYRKLLSDAYRDDIDLSLIISPAHAYLPEASASAGLWDVWEEWKLALVLINEDEAAKVGQPPFPLWDFSGYNSITTEIIPTSKSEGDRPEGYWDPGHYRRQVGTLVLDRVFGLQSGTYPAPVDFGVFLDSGNISTHLAQTRSARAAYRESHAEEVMQLEQVVETALDGIQHK